MSFKNNSLFSIYGTMVTLERVIVGTCGDPYRTRALETKEGSGEKGRERGGSRREKIRSKFDVVGVEWQMEPVELNWQPNHLFRRNDSTCGRVFNRAPKTSRKIVKESVGSHNGAGIISGMLHDVLGKRYEGSVIRRVQHRINQLSVMYPLVNIVVRLETNPVDADTVRAVRIIYTVPWQRTQDESGGDGHENWIKVFYEWHNKEWLVDFIDYQTLLLKKTIHVFAFPTAATTLSVVVPSAELLGEEWRMDARSTLAFVVRQRFTSKGHVRFYADGLHNIRSPLLLPRSHSLKFLVTQEPSAMLSLRLGTEETSTRIEELVRALQKRFLIPSPPREACRGQHLFDNPILAPRTRARMDKGVDLGAVPPPLPRSVWWRCNLSGQRHESHHDVVPAMIHNTLKDHESIVIKRETTEIHAAVKVAGRNPIPIHQHLHGDWIKKTSDSKVPVLNGTGNLRSYQSLDIGELFLGLNITKNKLVDSDLRRFCEVSLYLVQERTDGREDLLIYLLEKCRDENRNQLRKYHAVKRSNPRPKLQGRRINKKMWTEEPVRGWNYFFSMQVPCCCEIERSSIRAKAAYITVVAIHLTDPRLLGVKRISPDQPTKPTFSSQQTPPTSFSKRKTMVTSSHTVRCNVLFLAHSQEHLVESFHSD